MKRTTYTVIVFMLMMMAFPLTPASAAPCPIGWGSLAKSVSGTPANLAALTNVRAGKNSCFDRLVLDNANWARVQYVSGVGQDGSGEPVPLRGTAFLQILTTRSDNVNTGQQTYPRPGQNYNELVNFTGFTEFKQLAFAGDFEGQTTLGLGVRARTAFRVGYLSNPVRIYVDVSRKW